MLQVRPSGALPVWEGNRVRRPVRVRFLANVLWLLLFGWSLALLSGALGLVLCVTVVGIPFGLQCFKFSKLALMPFGASVR